MGKPSLFQAYLDNPSGVYYSGQLVSGKVILESRKSIKCRELRVEALGRANVHWTETRQRSRVRGVDRSNRSRHETIHYNAAENYYNFAIPLFKPGDVARSEITAGKYEYRFQFVLPQSCGTSFEGSYGHIRHSITAIIDRPWKFDHTSKLPFTVLSVYDLNREPMARQPINLTKEKTLGALFWKSGSLKCTLAMPQRGYVPGQSMEPRVTIQNDSGREIKVKLYLKQMITFSAYHFHWKTRTSANKVAELAATEKVGEHSNQTLMFSDFKVPSVPPEKLGCGIINIAYNLQVEVDPSGMSTDLDMYTPIIIGSIPLSHTAGEFGGHEQYSQPGFYPEMPVPTGMPPGSPPPNPAPPSFVLNPNDPQVAPSAPPFETYSDIAPPAYEECIGGRQSVREDSDQHHYGGDLNYAPLYPIYELQQKQ